MQEKVMVGLSQGPKTQDDRPKMQNGKQTAKMVTIILEYFVFQSCLISAFMHIVCVDKLIEIVILCIILQYVICQVNINLFSLLLKK